MSDDDDSQAELPDQVLVEPGEDDDSGEIPSGRPWIEDLTDLRAWCKDRHAKWPQLKDALLPESHFDWAEELACSLSTYHLKGRVDYTQFPFVFAYVFSFRLDANRTLALLKYFLGFVAELIMLDTVEDDEEAAKIRALLGESIQPACQGMGSVVPTLGLTVSPDSNESE